MLRHVPRHPLRRTPLLVGALTLAVGAAAVVGCAPSRHYEAASAAAPVPVRTPAELVPHVPHPPTSRSRPPAARRVGVMPHGNLRGWTQVLAEDFRGRTVPRGWSSYEGQPGGNPFGAWTHDRVVPTGSALRLHGSWAGNRFTTGGLMLTGLTQAYGKYEVRFKVDRGQGVSYALLLWPATGQWPHAGEIDFAEDGGGDRKQTTATLHYGWDNSQVQRKAPADFSRFQTVGVEWTPRKIVYTLNGRPWAVLAGADVPSGPMNLALQLEAGRGTPWSAAPTRATPATVDLTVDWVVAYRR